MVLFATVFQLTALVTVVASLAAPHIQLPSFETDTIQSVNDFIELPPIHQFKNLQHFQQNIHQFMSNINYTTDPSPQPFVIQLTDSNKLIFPEYTPPSPDEQIKNGDGQLPIHSRNYVSPPVPIDWIELYGSNIVQQSSTQPIEIQTLSVVVDDSARGEVAYSTGRLQKISTEYDSKISLYLGFIAFIGLTSGLTFAPELEFSTSTSIYYTCPVLAGQTVVIKVYPTLTTFTPYTKKWKWDSKLGKFATKLPSFKKLQKVSLFTLTGLEDVECFYTS
ncbi:hypothetical protein K4G60_g4733 [Candida parapsilosis]|nr:hypothetical protein K4G60_g4733 [Candida parapsilosis]KAI5910674.1 hypothetical protein K4G61_g4374 [Candida parapsilosis]CAD1810939.1 unnamed protein product [Candida parapsilosis]